MVMQYLDFRSEPKTDELTPEERAAIDAFPAEKIQKIPTGARRLDFEYAWDGTRLRAVNPDGRRMTREETLTKLKSFRAPSKVKPTVLWQVRRGEINRQKVQDAIAAGARTNKEIRKATGLCESTVYSWLHHLGIDPQTLREEPK